MPSFNLVTEPWIGGTTLDGKPCELSLADVLGQAHRLAAIDDNSPLCTAALHRLLLAIIHRALDGPKNLDEWNDLWEQGTFSSTPIFSYLEKWKDHFDLFSTTVPFFQTANFELKEPTSANRLPVELSRRFFNHSPEDGPEAFSPPEIARYLVTAQLSALAGGKGVTSNFGEHPYISGGPMAGAVATLLLGKNLFETLMLNCFYYFGDSPMPRIGDDLPIWEQDTFDKPFGDRVPNGYVDYLTWKSRHIRLLPEEQLGKTVVRWMYIGQAYSLPKERLRDPMFFLKINEKEGTKYPVGLSPERAFWRDSGSLFTFGEDKDDQRPQAFKQANILITKYGYLSEDYPLKCMILGLGNDKGNPLIWRQEFLPVPTELLTNPDVVHELQLGLQHTEAVRAVLNQAIWKLAELILAAGDTKRKIDKNSVRNLMNSFGTMRLYWNSLELPFRQLLETLKTTDASALVNWKKQVNTLAKKAFEETSDNCLGRTVRELQARVQAESWLSIELSKLKPKTEAAVS